MTRRRFLSGVAAAVLSPAARAVFAAADAKTALPEYYNACLDAVAAKVNARAGKVADGFWFITDLHITSNRRNSGKAIAALSARVPSITKTLCGGDLPEAFSQRFESPKAGVDYAVDYYRLFWVEPIEAFGQRLYTAKGNHDFTIRLNAQSPEGFTYPGTEARRIVMGSKGGASAVTNPDDPEACYYYFDNAAAKVRYIVADTTDSITDSRVYWAVIAGMHAPQLHWLAEKAFSTIPDGWCAVVMHHIPITGCVGTDAEEQKFAPFRTLLEAYQNRGTWSFKGRTWDFAGAKGRILMDLTGHHHAERQTFRNGILHVTQPCDAAYSDYILGSKPWCGDLPHKKPGTPQEQTFDAVQLAPADNLVYFTRVGGGQDRVIHTEPVTLKVGQTHTFTATHLKGPLTWGCYDGTHITRTPNPKNRYNPFVGYSYDLASFSPEGVLTARKPGPVMALAMDAALNKEIFPVVIG